MKKVLAIIFALVLTLSFAACGSDSKNENNATTTAVTDATTEATAAAGTPVVPDNTQQEEEATTTEAAEIAVADTVEAWIAANQEYVDELCALYSSSEEGVNIDMVITAEGNDLCMTGVISGDYTDEDIAEAEEEALAEQEAWDALTAEEKEEMLQYYILDENMPVPESVTTIICDENANVLAHTIFSK